MHHGITHQAANITLMPVEHLNLITKYPDDAEAVINQLFVNPDKKATKCYPTPETCSEPEKLNVIERRIYDEILALRELEKLDPSQSDEQRMNFLKNFTVLMANRISKSDKGVVLISRLGLTKGVFFIFDIPI